jgi:Delta7-sterol 5-desaturase
MEMEKATTLVGIARDHSLHMFAFDFGRYFIAASLIVAVVWLLKRTPLKTRQIQLRSAKAEDFRREFLASVRTVLVYVVVSIFVVWGIRNGVLNEFEGGLGLWGDLGMLAAIIVAHDAYFYWSHRMMHHPRLFKTFHRFHHRTVTPTAWAAYSFAVPEAFVMAIFMPIWLFLVPTPGSVTFAFLAIMILRNTMGHAGLELHARGWASHPILKWISTTTHHDLHHAGSFNHNFGFYFTWWDKLMGTEHPDYVATYDRVTAKPVLAKDTELAPSPVL